MISEYNKIRDISSEYTKVSNILKGDDSLNIQIDEYKSDGNKYKRVVITRIVVESGTRSERLIHYYRIEEFSLRKLLDTLRCNLTKNHFLDFQMEDRKYLYDILKPYDREHKLKILLD